MSDQKDRNVRQGSPKKFGAPIPRMQEFPVEKGAPVPSMQPVKPAAPPRPPAEGTNKGKGG